MSEERLIPASVRKLSLSRTLASLFLFLARLHLIAQFSLHAESDAATYRPRPQGQLTFNKDIAPADL